MYKSTKHARVSSLLMSLHILPETAFNTLVRMDNVPVYLYLHILYYCVRIGRCCLDETVITVGNLHPIIMFTRIIKPLISIGFCQFIVARHKLCNIPQVILSLPRCVILWPYLIIVTDATDGVSVNFFGRCKFLQI